ncbi:rhomboid family intramembrane serine protease [Aquimarina aggregata]|uniref:Rhomboid family intramembrane serine protease n=1 Tax=Aquimarina aggregata TaxID=1642818 RepID=A0A162X879_9FLAO|nr:rhomboid family intramembrane serine protease [Aquimarina aggregata]KZS38480.1 rhomboid family intramembrane serine protease [Aquimarina aggregata]
MATNNLTYQFKTANIIIKLIVINAALFLFATLGGWGLQMRPDDLMGWFVLPTEFNALILQIWGVVTYSFLHFGFWHIFWNMLLLYWFGQFVLNLFTEKRFLTIYLLGAVCGGILFVLAYNFLPALNARPGYIIGASAAVLAIVIFIATYTPNAEVRVIFFNVKLWQIGVFMVLMDLIQLPNQSPETGNAGGMIAHIGGALFGFIYATQLKKGNDIGAWFEKLMDGFANLFKPKKKSPLKTVHKSKTYAASSKRTTSSGSKIKNPNQGKIDAILDKISKSGYESLTKEEKDFLFKAGKE